MRRGRYYQMTVQTASAIGSGDPTLDWSNATTVTTIFATLESLVGSEAFAAKQYNPELSHRLHTPYLTGVTITPAMRIVFGSRYFDIQSIQNLDEENREWEILAIERV